MSSSKVLITGATGFVGRAILERLRQEGGLTLVAAVRRWDGPALEDVSIRYIGPFSGETDWGEVVEGVSTVVHCAARVHVMSERSTDPLAAFRAVNVDATLSLARQAAAAGAKRFIFISSIKVNGEGSEAGRPYVESDAPSPADAYGLSKLEAEIGLKALASTLGLEVVIIRPVLVYGPGVKANFHSMMSWLSKGVPLPLGAVRNKRSLVALDNLVDLIVTCMKSPAAANETFLVSDGEDVSTTELLQRLGRALGKPARLFPVPAPLLRAGAALLGRQAVADRLYGTLQVDIAKAQELLGWRPAVSLDEALRRTANDFLSR